MCPPAAICTIASTTRRDQDTHCDEPERKNRGEGGPPCAVKSKARPPAKVLEAQLRCDLLMGLLVVCLVLWASIKDRQEHKRIDAILDRLCKRHSRKGLLVPESVHKMWKQGGKTKTELKDVLIQCGCNKDPA